LFKQITIVKTLFSDVISGAPYELEDENKVPMRSGRYGGYSSSSGDGRRSSQHSYIDRSTFIGRHVILPTAVTYV